MRGHLLVFGVLIGCGEVEGEGVDAPEADAAIDAAPDAAGCQPKSLLMGGAAVEPQGWAVVSQAPSAVTYGPDYVRLETSTATGATTSGQLLLSYPGALPAPPFQVQIVLLVERVNPHNQLDAGAAILGAFTPPFGTGTDRNQMIYFDGGAIGWADNTQAFTASITNNAYHTVELAVNAGGAAQVTLDGIAALARAGYVSNGALAIGDQTNDVNVDGAIRIRSVTLLCP